MARPRPGVEAVPEIPLQPGEDPHPAWKRYLSLKTCFTTSPYLRAEGEEVERWFESIHW